MKRAEGSDDGLAGQFDECAALGPGGDAARDLAAQAQVETCADRDGAIESGAGEERPVSAAKVLDDQALGGRGQLEVLAAERGRRQHDGGIGAADDDGAVDHDEHVLAADRQRDRAGADEAIADGANEGGDGFIEGVFVEPELGDAHGLEALADRVEVTHLSPRFVAVALFRAIASSGLEGGLEGIDGAAGDEDARLVLFVASHAEGLAGVAEKLHGFELVREDEPFGGQCGARALTRQVETQQSGAALGLEGRSGAGWGATSGDPEEREASGGVGFGVGACHEDACSIEGVVGGKVGVAGFIELAECFELCAALLSLALGETLDDATQEAHGPSITRGPPGRQGGCWGRCRIA